MASGRRAFGLDVRRSIRGSRAVHLAAGAREVGKEEKSGFGWEPWAWLWENRRVGKRELD